MYAYSPHFVYDLTNAAYILCVIHSHTSVRHLCSGGVDDPLLKPLSPYYFRMKLKKNNNNNLVSSSSSSDSNHVQKVQTRFRLGA